MKPNLKGSKTSGDKFQKNFKRNENQGLQHKASINTNPFKPPKPPSEEESKVYNQEEDDKQESDDNEELEHNQYSVTTEPSTQSIEESSKARVIGKV